MIGSLVKSYNRLFIKEQWILGNIVVVEELLFSLQKHQIPGNILKIDFSKTFDIVDWDFLQIILIASDFGAC